MPVTVVIAAVVSVVSTLSQPWQVLWQALF